MTQARRAMADPVYERQWRDYRSRRWWFYAVWLGGFAALALIAFGLLPLIPKAMAGPVFVVAGLAWMLGFVVVAVRLQRFACPRCDRAFFVTSLSYWPFARECRHCGLARD